MSFVNLRCVAWMGVLGLAGCSNPSSGGSASDQAPSDGSASTGEPADATDGQVGPSTSGDPDPTDDDSAGDDTGPDDPPPGPWSSGVPIPEDPQVPGDPEAGYRALLEEGYISCGIPYALFDLAQPFFGQHAQGDPLPGRTGDNADVPYNWTVFETDDGVRLATVNCLECHAGYFNGELVVGLGRADYDSTAAMGDLLELVPSPEIPDLLPNRPRLPGDLRGLEEMARWVNRMRTLAPVQRAPTIGVNHAVSSAVALVAHREPQTLAWSDTPLLDYPQYLIPTDTPPWWRVSKKHGLFYNAMARGDHRGTMVLASSLCTDDVDELDSIMTYFADVRAYLASLEAPAYPFAIDGALAERGQDVYAQSCAGCHGTYGSADSASYPNLLFALDVIGTDPLMAEAASQLPEFSAWFEDSPYGEYTNVVTDDPFPGYVAPPLDGIWATAPFFHNGSVPTLELVLDSTRRPTYWRRVDYDSENFDEDALGWPFLALDLEWVGGADGMPEDEAKHVYDATRLGYWNGGHTFGDALSDDDRRALLEYLKTL